MAWTDDVKLRLYVSTSGDFVSLGTRTQIPIVAGGPGGIPSGFTFYSTVGNATGINLTTAMGRFSVSNGTPGDPKLNAMYGATVDFPIVAGKRYIMNVQAQVMEGRNMALRDINQSIPATAVSWGTRLPAVSPWENIALYGNFEPSNGTMRFRMAVMNQNPDEMNWGVQFQNLSYIALDSSYPDPTWHEVTCDIRNFQVRSGRERTTNRYEVAQASLGIINNSGQFSYQPNHPWGLRPGRFIKVEATYRNSIFSQFYGIIDGMNNSYTIDGLALTTMNCVDVSSLLANQTVPSMSAPDTMVTSDVRFTQMLNGVAWHPSQVDTAGDGVFLQQGIVANGRTVRDELGLIADSEGSYFFANRAGRLFYRGRDWADRRITTVGAEILAQLPTDPIKVPAVKFQFPGVKGNYFETPHNDNLNTPNDLEVTFRFSFDSWAGPGGFIVSKYVSAWYVQKANGAKYLNFTPATGNPMATPVLNMVDGQMWWFRCRYVRATGAVNWWYAIDQDTEPTVGWIPIGSTLTTVTTGTPNTTAPLNVGGNQYGNSAPGRIGAVIVRGTAGTTPVFEMWERDAANSPGALAFTSASGHPMTVYQTAGNVIIKDDSRFQLLPDVDSIPNYNATIPILCANGLEPSWSRDRIVNDLSLANQGGSAFTVIDEQSQKDYGPRTYSRLDFLNDNSHPEYLATRASDIMDGYTEAIGRINAVSFNPDVNKDGWRWILETFLNELVRVRYTHPTEGWGFSAVAHIQGIEHTVDTKHWATRLSLDDYEAFSYWVDIKTETGWDTGFWDDDIWDGAGDPSSPAFWNARYNWSDPNSKWG